MFLGKKLTEVNALGASDVTFRCQRLVGGLFNVPPRELMLAKQHAAAAHSTDVFPGRPNSSVYQDNPLTLGALPSNLKASF